MQRTTATHVCNVYSHTSAASARLSRFRITHEDTNARRARPFRKKLRFTIGLPKTLPSPFVAAKTKCHAVSGPKGAPAPCPPSTSESNHLWSSARSMTEMAPCNRPGRAPSGLIAASTCWTSPTDRTLHVHRLSAHHEENSARTRLRRWH